jgi:hypothetical protein
MSEQASPSLSREDAQTLAAIAWRTGTEPGEILRRAIKLYKMVIAEEERKAALTRRGAGAKMPARGERGAMVASGSQAALWHDGDEIFI